MERHGNKGSVSVYMILLLIPTVICVCIIIGCAQLVSSMGMGADAVGLAENAVMSSYNHPIKDTYGLVCYTKSENEMNNIANYYLNRSLPDNISGQVEVTYPSGYSLSDNDELLAQINKYMSRWYRIAAVDSLGDTYTIKRIMGDASVIRSRIENNYNSALASERNVLLVFPEEQQERRRNAIPEVEADDMTIGADQVYLNYPSAASDIIGAGNRKISYENTVSENISIGLDILEDVEDYYEPVEQAYYSQMYRNENYMLALYVYNNFSAFRYYGCTSLTGNYYRSGDIVSVCPWGENEFIINGTNDTLNNFNKTKYMIYESLFAEYIVALYDLYQNDENIINYATAAAGEHVAYIPVIKDEIIIGMCAKLAYDQMLDVYKFNGDCVLISYPQYMQLFCMVEVERNRDAFIDRMKYIITINANNSSNPEAREFGFTNAWTRVCIE